MKLSDFRLNYEDLSDKGWVRDFYVKTEPYIKKLWQAYLYRRSVRRIINGKRIIRPEVYGLGIGCVLIVLVVLSLFSQPLMSSSSGSLNPLIKPPRLAQKLSQSDLKAQLRERAIVITPKPASMLSISPTAGVTNCGSDPNMAWIYQRESSCNTAGVNAGGCFGIGQDCNGVVQIRCGTNFACQDSYFRNYAISRYGSTYQAMLVWQSQGWY